MTLKDQIDELRAVLIARHQEQLTKFDQARSLIVGLGVQDPPEIPNRITCTVPSVRSFVAARRRTAAAPVARRSTAKPATPRDTSNSMADKVRAIISGWAGDFTVEMVRDQVAKRYGGDTHPVTCTLINMVTRKEITSSGKGRTRTYRRATLKKTSATDAYREFRSTVPAPAAAE